MLASLLTTLGFSLSVIFAGRSTRLLGGPMANLAKLLVAAVLLAFWAHTYGGGLGGGGLAWFFLSGVIGFGLGDMAVFASLERIGPRLAILLTQCLAAPIGALAEWIWLGTPLHLPGVASATVILAGVGLALAPDHGWEGERRTFWIGSFYGVLSAFGQALGAVFSRKANDVAAIVGGPVDGATAAYQRILGGVLMTLLAFAFVKKMRPVPGKLDGAIWRRAWPFVVANACTGPVFGVACYQWALSYTETSIVLPIVATSPLLTMLLAWPIDGIRPARRASVGGLLAVAGVIGLRYFSGSK